VALFVEEPERRAAFAGACTVFVVRGTVVIVDDGVCGGLLVAAILFSSHAPGRFVGAVFLALDAFAPRRYKVEVGCRDQEGVSERDLSVLVEADGIVWSHDPIWLAALYRHS